MFFKDYFRVKPSISDLIRPDCPEKSDKSENIYFIGVIFNIKSYRSDNVDLGLGRP